MKDETRHSSLLLHLKQECDRLIESCLVSRYLLIHKQGLDSTQPNKSARGDRTRSNTPPWHTPRRLRLQPATP
ncbi:MAG: hypothetical protein F6K28_31365 [Microcoleus sp. SIO2G3]|nr:hypothetical protein [Microcoleus sp. SIO2G3]